MNFSLRTVFLLGLILTCLSAKAQERCGTVENHKFLQQSGRMPASDQLFEDWLKKKSTALKTGSFQRVKTSYKIPVVVHVIHNGEAVGTGTNISDAQILSQISVLNEDFRRLNEDATQTPSEFLPVAGNLDIEFVMAKSDPEGLPSNGIVRVKGSKSGWTLADQYELKAQSYWPAEDYLNLWVCDQVDDLVGYSQYPESDLPGVINPSMNRLTDGVVVWYKAFGSVDDGNFDLSSNYNKGRTLTHELGHFFGLRHIWGDDSSGCDGDDFVSDTPNQAGSTSGCPSHPRTSCGTVNMFQNYMDYTSDACMNLFTKQQLSRVSTVLENSPRRVTLLTSPGLSNPLVVQNDLGIRSIIAPTSYQCASTFAPSIEIRNYGTANITSAKVQLTVNGTATETKNITLNLSNLETSIVSFTSLTGIEGSNQITFEVTQVNGGVDENSRNNMLSLSYVVPQTVNTPFSENFNTLPTDWTIINPDGKITWDIATAPRDNSLNKALRLNLFDYEESYGEVDILLSPTFSLSSAPVASLVFDLAYTRYLSSNDRLKIVLLRNCEPLEEGIVIYEKAGSELRTVNSTSGSFTPTSVQDWRREFVNISGFIGQANVQLAFVAISDWGNNLYLDNISVTTTELEDVELQSLEAPSFITCEPTPSPFIVAQNIGTKVINSLTIQYSVNGSSRQFTVSNLNASFGSEIRIPMPAITLTAATNTIAVTLINPNGQPDQSPSNNSKTFTLFFDSSSQRIPLRQNFDKGLDNWKAYSADDGRLWQATNTNFSGSVVYNAFANPVLNEASWLLSPVLDFSAVNEASMVFDFAYRSRNGQHDRLFVYGSKDCGNTFEEVTAVTLTDNSSVTSWSPSADSDWQKDVVVDLTRYAGLTDVRIAFVVINDNGNNLYIDNIEFFTVAKPVLISANEPYDVYGYNLEDPDASRLFLTFNLPEQSDVEYSIIDMMGKIQAQSMLSNVLNQTYLLDEEKKLSSGTYLIKIRVGRQSYSKRFLIVR